MKGLKFDIKGKTAFFKKPDVNTYYYFSYGCIHKIALLGIFGAILGYGGYGKQYDEKTEFPEFYQNLKDLHLAIIPKNSKGNISKKIQSFNNSVGYASKEEGGNLIVKEQWLENPHWEIFFPINNEETEKLAERLEKRQYTYLPYLGKNNHPATIENVQICDYTVEKISKGEYLIDSLFFKKMGTLTDPETSRSLRRKLKEPSFKYQEKLPIALEATQNQYITDYLCYTNWILTVEQELDLYHVEENNYILI